MCVCLPAIDLVLSSVYLSSGHIIKLLPDLIHTHTCRKKDVVKVWQPDEFLKVNWNPNYITIWRFTLSLLCVTWFVASVMGSCRCTWNLIWLGRNNEHMKSEKFSYSLSVSRFTLIAKCGVCMPGWSSHTLKRACVCEQGSAERWCESFVHMKNVFKTEIYGPWFSTAHSMQILINYIRFRLIYLKRNNTLTHTRNTVVDMQIARPLCTTHTRRWILLALSTPLLMFFSDVM